MDSIQICIIESCRKFVAIDSSECPANTNLPGCSSQIAPNQLCEADMTLPDGNTNFNVNNCDDWDVFKCISGKSAEFRNVSSDNDTQAKIVLYFRCISGYMYVILFLELPPTCSDGEINEKETGIDCGGACPNSCPGRLIN